MASDLDLLIGKWTVHVKKWTWEYEFVAGGKVKWRDVNSKEKGNGGWAASSKLVNLFWTGSSTRESWQRPLTASTDRTWYQSHYFVGKYKIEKGGAAPPSGLSDTAKINSAYQASRDSLLFALNRLRALQSQLTVLDGASPPAGALDRIKTEFKRDIAVVALRLIVPSDPADRAFRSALTKAIGLMEQNYPLPKSIFAARTTRKCADPRPAFAWTTPGRKPPDTDVCTSWFNASEALRRDVITHEYFHTVGLADISVNNTAEGLNNANTMAQVVAFIADRTRQIQSDGHEPAVPPLPSP